MMQCGYNPQEVLSPLMQRFGRSLRCGRSEGFGRMVTAVSEALHVNRTNARHLVQSLASSGLVDFEMDLPAVSVAERERQFVPAGPAQVPESASASTGVWRIGPSV